MFAAALLPGVLAVLLFLLTIAIYVVIRPEAGPGHQGVDATEFRDATMGVVPVLAIFGIVLGGIYAGFYNPTPAAAVGVALVWLYGAWTREIRGAEMVEALRETAGTTGMIYLILFGAELLKIYMSRIGLPQATAEWILATGLAPMAVLVLLLLALIFLGCLMDSLSMNKPSRVRKRYKECAYS